ncbi:MAG: DUF1801 domain-containing protein [Cyclobacteriaceae bacterium]|nr:DUF1801 domain-containing protein [Cyclobacteriaceae bacterium]
MPIMKAYSDVDAYIKDQPKQIHDSLKKLRAAIIKAAPKAQESISYGMPAYKFHGALVYFGGFKNHISFFPVSSGVAHFSDQLKEFKTAKGTIQFPFDKPIPVKLVTAIVKFRVQENLEKEAMKVLTKKSKKK